MKSLTLVNNPTLRASLRSSIRLLEGKLGDTRSLFQREDWKMGPDTELKKEVLAYLGDYASSFNNKGWNDGSEPPLVPMIQKLPSTLAHLVAKCGLAVLPVEDNGLFGRGYYFTNNIDHLDACTASIPLLNDIRLSTGVEDVYLLSLVLPGNSFPLLDTEENSAVEMSCAPGYQSNFATINRGNGGKAGELVIFDPSHALPLFIWTQEKCIFTFTPRERREWVIVQDSTWKGESPFSLRWVSP